MIALAGTIHNKCNDDGGKIIGVAFLTKRQFRKLTMTKDEKIWAYLTRKLKPLKDNNKTARDIYQYLIKLK